MSRLGLATLLPLLFAAAGIAAMPITLFDDCTVEIVCSQCGMTTPKRAGLEFEARILALQADNLMRAGDPRRAAEVAAEAIGVARRKADRLSECHASLVGACLARSGSAREAHGLLSRAGALIDETGAKAYEAMMLRMRAQITHEK